jgi:arylsulfatase A-like enzyme
LTLACISYPALLKTAIRLEVRTPSWVPGATMRSSPDHDAILVLRVCAGASPRHPAAIKKTTNTINARNGRGIANRSRCVPTRNDIAPSSRHRSVSKPSKRSRAHQGTAPTPSVDVGSSIGGWLESRANDRLRISNEASVHPRMQSLAHLGPSVKLYLPRLPACSVVVLMTALAWTTGCQPNTDSAPQPEGPPPNVLLISIDTLRPDHLGAYGYERETSPRIDRLAAEGALFETAISSSSWTLPAHAALFTGLSDSVHGCDDSNRRLDESRRTLAEVFAERGYQTVGFFAGPFLHPTFGLAQGFERYVDCSSYAEQSKQVAIRDGSLDTADIMDASHTDITNPRVYAQFKHWIEQERSDPFFMFVHLWDAHFDFVPPPPYDTMFDPTYTGDVDGIDFFRNPKVHPHMNARDLDHVLALYDGEIAWTDQHVGMILDDLDAKGLLDNTIVALVSDHGEEFFEHGAKGHRFTLYDEVIRIPMIFWFPKKIPAGLRINNATSIIDVFPTLLELAGSAKTEEPMGRSLVPYFDPTTAATVVDRLAISELNTLGNELASFRSADYKILADSKSGRQRMYDLRIDRREGLPTPIGRVGSDRERAVVQEMRALKTWLNKKKKALQAPPSTPALSDALVEQLQVLGYLDEAAPSLGVVEVDTNHESKELTIDDVDKE